ncbi:MAG: HDOD domain-containing protein [Fimbriimonadaceae bacterium]|nr:HDOD domain-containing protein [Fimbriimonadaceae bacterium]
MPFITLGEPLKQAFLAKLKHAIALETAVPHMAEAAVELKRVIEKEDEPSTATLYKIIAGSPALTAMVLRSASSASSGATDRVTDVRRAILVLGKRSLLAIAIASIVQAIISERAKKALLDPQQFVLHSTFVGVMARFLFELQVREHGHKSEFLADEVFAAGILHDVGIGLFAVTEPMQFRKMVESSRLHVLTVSDEYLRTYDESSYELTTSALKAWDLSPEMRKLVGAMTDPESHPTESRTAACLVYADYIAETFGFGLTKNLATTECPAFVQDAVGMSSDEELEVTDLIGEVALGCLPKKNAA